jgi:hypothetical protein
MNAQQSTRTPLPELSPARIDEIEDSLFADIARARSAARARRGKVWLGAGAAAAVIVVAAVIAPSIGALVTGSAESGFAGGTTGELAPDAGLSGEEYGSTESGPTDAGGVDTSGTDSGRSIITTASATVVVEDPAAAARTVGNAAVARGGYVESLNIGSTGEVMPMSPDGGISSDEIYPYPQPLEGAWITVRVPADELTEVIDELSDVGEVTASTVNRQDVTEQTVDLEARVEASQASVDRLTELLGEATSVADLLAAESALAERQAMLESYQQQLESLEGLVELSALSVTLTPEVEPVSADPAGFGDGIAAGWNGLVATLNGIVVALGFLLPWLAVIGVAALIVWGVIRLVRRSRRTPPRPDDAAE